MTNLSEDRQVLVNLEINKDCQLTRVCGTNCFLNLVERSLPGIRRFSSDIVLAAAREVIDHGQTVRHLGIVGKEPLDTPDILFEVLRHYRQSPVATRPGSIGITTSGLKLRQHTAKFVESPLDWCAVSIDTADSGLHVERWNQRLVTDLLSLRETAGTEMALVNTVFTENNHNSVIDLGRWVCESGVDQWALSTMMTPRADKMRPGVSRGAARRLLDRVVKRFGNADCQILFEVQLDEFQRISGKPVPDRWRAEHNIGGTNVWLVSPNFDRGYFVRMRWDGELLSKQDFLQLGLRRSTFGQYKPGRLTNILCRSARIKKERRVQ